MAAQRAAICGPQLGRAKTEKREKLMKIVDEPKSIQDNHSEMEENRNRKTPQQQQQQQQEPKRRMSSIYNNNVFLMDADRCREMREEKNGIYAS